jgi:hypothetical protein
MVVGFDSGTKHIDPPALHSVTVKRVSAFKDELLNKSLDEKAVFKITSDPVLNTSSPQLLSKKFHFMSKTNCSASISFLLKP